MSDGTSVGKISLDIDLTGNITKQVNEMAGKIGSALKGSIESSTKGMFKGLERTIDKSMDTVRNIITQQLDRMKEEAAAIMKSLQAITKKIKIPKNFGIPQDAKIPQSNTVSTTPVRGPPVANINTGFDAERIKSQIDNLTQSLDITNAKIEQQKSKLADLKGAYERAFDPGKKNKLQEEILKVETNINKLISTSDKTGFKLADLDDKLLSVSNSTKKMNSSLNNTVAKLNETASSAVNASNKASKLNSILNNTDGTVRRTTKNLSNSTRAAVDMGKNTSRLGPVANNIGNKFTSMGKLISSALKRVLIMATLYKVIRGFMSYMGSALATNQQFSNSLAQIKTNLQVAFMPIYQAILPALNALMSALSTVTAYIASFVSAIFGKTYKQSFKAAEGLNTAKASMAGVGKQAKKTAKEVQNSLAGFDEINNLDFSSNKDNGEGAGVEVPSMVTPSIDMNPVEANMKALADKLKALFDPTIASLKNLWGAMEPFRKFVAQGAIDFWNNFLKPVGNWVFGEGIPRFIDALANGFASVDWERINGSLNNLWNALTPFTINVGEGLLWFWENVLVPLGTWTLNNVVPLFLDILAEAITVLNVVINALKPLGNWLWESFLKPLAEWTGGIIVSILENISNALKGISDWISENQSLVEVLTVVVGSFAAAWGLVNAAVAIWNVVGAIAAGITTALGAALTFLTSPIGIVIAIIGALIAAGVLLYKNWDEIKIFAGKLWDGIKDIFGKIGSWIGDTFNNIKDSISDNWNKAKDVTSKVWGNMKESVESHGGGIKGFISASAEANKKAWESAFNYMDKLTDGKMTDIKNSIVNIFNSVKSSIANIWASIASNLAKVWSGLIGTSRTIFTNVSNTIKGVFTSIPNWFKNIFTVAWNNVKNVFSSGGKIFTGIKDGIANTFKTIVNGLINGINRIISIPFNSINRMLNTIRNVGVLGLKPFSGLWRQNPLSIPKIPKLARGGVIDQPTLAMVGEQGKEAVMPLENNTGWIDNLAGQLATKMGGSGSSHDRDLLQQIVDILLRILDALLSNDGDMILKIGESELGKATIKAINKVQGQAGKTLLEL